jgi:alpha-tubulin suppressor-like RCC1 family protein
VYVVLKNSSKPVGCGVVASWGRGEDGQLGHGDANETSEPKAVYSLIDVGVRVSQRKCKYSFCMPENSSHIRYQRYIYHFVRL